MYVYVCIVYGEDYIVFCGCLSLTELTLEYYRVQILWRGQESIIADVGAPEEWDKKAGIKSVDGF